MGRRDTGNGEEGHWRVGTEWEQRLQDKATWEVGSKFYIVNINATIKFLKKI